MELSKRNPGRTHGRNQRAGWFSCACCVFRRGASAAETGVPRTGRPVQANFTIL